MEALELFKTGKRKKKDSLWSEFVVSSGEYFLFSSSGILAMKGGVVKIFTCGYMSLYPWCDCTVFEVCDMARGGWIMISQLVFLPKLQRASTRLIWLFLLFFYYSIFLLVWIVTKWAMGHP